MTFYVQVRVNQFNMAAILRRKTQMLYSGSNKRKVITVGHPQVCCSIRVIFVSSVWSIMETRELVGPARKWSEKNQKIFKR